MDAIFPKVSTVWNERHVRACARGAHEACRAYADAVGTAVFPPWERLNDEDTRALLRSVVDALAGATASGAHQARIDGYVADGWTFGEVASEKKKRHPGIRNWADLPPEEREIRMMFYEVVAVIDRALVAVRP